jgi:hypothetical protein
VIIHPAVDVVERRAAKVFFNREAKRQLYFEPQATLVRIDPHQAELKLQMQDSWTGLAANFPSDDRRAGRINADNAEVEHTFPAGGVHERRPHDIGRRIDDGGWQLA